MKRSLKLVVLVISAYVGSYFVISRTSLSLNRKYGIKVFYYCPCDAKALSLNSNLQLIHSVGKYVFYPIWLIDYHLGGPQWGYPALFTVEDQ